jgi:hypothetical protein
VGPGTEGLGDADGYGGPPKAGFHDRVLGQPSLLFTAEAGSRSGSTGSPTVMLSLPHTLSLCFFLRTVAAVLRPITPAPTDRALQARHGPLHVKGDTSSALSVNFVIELH